MSLSADLEALERRAYLTLWDDGLIDASAGLGLVAVGVAWLTDNIALGAIVPAFMVPFWLVARKYVSLPRAGVVRLGARRAASERRKLGLLAATGCAVLLLLTGILVGATGRSGPGPGLLPALVPALPGLLVAMAAALVALLFGIGRYLAHALALALIAVAGTRLGMEPGWHLLAGGTWVTLYSTVLLILFLRSHRAGLDEESPGP